MRKTVTLVTALGVAAVVAVAVFFHTAAAAAEMYLFFVYLLMGDPTCSM